MILEIAILGLIGGAIFGGKKKTKTTTNYRQGGDEISEVTYHDTGKTVVYRNGKRER